MLALLSRSASARIFPHLRSATTARRYESSTTASAGPRTTLPDSSIPILQTLDQLRSWRSDAFSEGKSVGFVPTMGALHEGHLSLVRRSLAENDLTIVSIFVNPTQFAPHEDLASYPRTLPQDLIALASLHSPSPSSAAPSRTTSAVFLPNVDVMYPPPPFLPPSYQRGSPSTEGTFVEVVPFGSLIEGASRPSFFRGVATVVTKLFNAVQPSHAYFGQKDIQQALLLRRMVRDLLVPYPTPETLHVAPTARSSVPEDAGLALSSRNAYLTPGGRVHAPALYRALKTGEQAWEAGKSKEDVIRAAHEVLEKEQRAAKECGVDMRVDYIEMNDPWTFGAVDGSETKLSGVKDRVLVLSGAVWVGRTRLIDNALLGDSSKILY